MDCPACNIKMACVDSASTGEDTFRKYKCLSCGKSVYTQEQVNEEAKIPLTLLREGQKKRNKEYKNAVSKRNGEFSCNQEVAKSKKTVSFSLYDDIKEALEEAIESEKNNSGARIIVVNIGKGEE